jgi:hypothetical protein
MNMKLIVLAMIVLTPLWVVTVVHAQKQMVLPTPTQTKLEVEPIAEAPIKAEEVVVLVEKDRRHFLQNQPVRRLLRVLNPFHRRCGEVQCREIQCREVQVRREVQRCKKVCVERRIKCCEEI